MPDWTFRFPQELNPLAWGRSDNIGVCTCTKWFNFEFTINYKGLKEVDQRILKKDILPMLNLLLRYRQLEIVADATDDVHENKRTN